MGDTESELRERVDPRCKSKGDEARMTAGEENGRDKLASEDEAQDDDAA